MRAFTEIRGRALVTVNFPCGANEVEHGACASDSRGNRPANDLAFAGVPHMNVVETVDSLGVRGVTGGPGAGAGVPRPGPGEIEDRNFTRQHRPALRRRLWSWRKAGCGNPVDRRDPGGVGSGYPDRSSRDRDVVRAAQLRDGRAERRVPQATTRNESDRKAGRPASRSLAVCPQSGGYPSLCCIDSWYSCRIWSPPRLRHSAMAESRESNGWRPVTIAVI